MKIGFVLNHFPELSQTFVLDQVLGLKARGHEVEVIAGRPGQAFESGLAAHGYDAAEINRLTLWADMHESLPLRTAASALKAVRLALSHPRLVAQAYDARRYGWFAVTGTLFSMAAPLIVQQQIKRPQEFDVIIAHFGPQGVIAAGLRELGLIEGPLVTYFHAFDLTSAPRTAGKNMYARLFAQGERMLAISERGRGHLLGLGAPPGKIAVHHMGVDLESFKAPSATRYSKSESPLRLLSVGRLCEKKGFVWALDAVFEAHRRGSSVSWTIIGSGPWRSKLKQRIEELKLSAVVKLEGAQSREQVISAFQSHDVLLVPSLVARNGDEEGIPMVIMEAIACRVAVIATRNGGIEELIEHNRTGLLVEERGVPELTSTIARIARNREELERYQEEAAARVNNEFSLDKQLTQLEDILTDLQEGQH